MCILFDKKGKNGQNNTRLVFDELEKVFDWFSVLDCFYKNNTRLVFDGLEKVLDWFLFL